MAKNISTITINASPKKVWDALTQPELVKLWQYGSELTTSWAIGSDIKFKAEWQGQVFEQWGKVLNIRPNALIRYSLFAPRPDLEDKPEHYFVMNYALKKVKNHTFLEITQEDDRPNAVQKAPEGADNPVLQLLKKIAETHEEKSENEKKMNFKLSVQRTIHAPIEKVWDALTHPELVKQYFFGTQLVTSWQLNSPIFFRGEWEGKPYEDKGTVLTFEPNKTLSFNYHSAWSDLEDRPENYQIITYSVKKKGDSTILTIGQRNIDALSKKLDSIKNWTALTLAIKKMME
jgi:uncharacterized protein YndB with AHSA1/START domain